MPEPTASNIQRGIDSNNARLASCPDHHFRKRDGAEEYICQACGGTVSLDAAQWHSLGKSHGLLEPEVTALLHLLQTAEPSAFLSNVAAKLRKMVVDPTPTHPDINRLRAVTPNILG